MEKQIKLEQFDNQPVQLRDMFDDVYEGYASYESPAYNFHEYGVEEEGLMIGYCLFYRSDIRSVRKLNETGPYAPFSSAFGTLEIMTAKAGIDLMEQVLDSEDEVHIQRLLRFLDQTLNPESSYGLDDPQAVLKMLREKLDYLPAGLAEEAQHILEQWG